MVRMMMMARVASPPIRPRILKDEVEKGGYGFPSQSCIASDPAEDTERHKRVEQSIGPRKMLHRLRSGRGY